ncbi:RNA-binding protein [Leptospira kmetyi]|uniref:RNA-binding protein n=1 Tax=Leptospira kmetyi TaxID=408139 RepID=UPI003EBE38DE
MVKTENRRVVFLPIKPEFAHKIINGEKNIEFRKKFSSQNVDTIIIYSSSPERRIIGFAKVDSIIFDSPSSLWNRFSKSAGIDKTRFFNYFDGKKIGVGIQIKSVNKLKQPVTPIQLGIQGSIPQNFKFVSEDTLTKVKNAI